MLRLHFTSDDLARIRVAARPDPLWEVVLSTNLLGNREGRAVFDAWRGRARERLRRLPVWMPRLLRALAPPYGDFPDFLTPSEAAAGMECGIEAVLSTPGRRLSQELAAMPRLPEWTAPLVRGEAAALTSLGQALRTYYESVLLPDWPRVSTHAQADVAGRARTLLHGGADALLESFRPLLRWTPPVLEADYPKDRDIHLTGRGVTLVPSVFCWRTVVTLIDPGLPPVVVYPVERTAEWWRPHARHPGQDTLQSLLGTTRAAVLRVAADGPLAGEVAQRIGLSLAATSYHLKALREARLISCSRRGTSTLLFLTPLGVDLLAENPPRPNQVY
ncbi:DUF5937 family protein [Streptomyces sp. NPDC052107]|uniref:ArsR/SmtB family transcription factor n=1 Tax=Streptomyces sp. NPDC052107 TaxID=3155632 RepID=UPI0034390A57